MAGRGGRARRAAHRLVVVIPGILALKALRVAERRPLRVLVALAALVLGLVPGLQKLTFSLSIPEMLDADDPRRLAAKEADDGFDAAEPLTVFIATADGSALGRPDLCAVKTWLHSVEMPEAFRVKRVVSPLHLTRATLLDGGRRMFYTPVLEDVCAGAGPGIEAVQGSPYGPLLVARDGSALAAVLQLRPLARSGRFGHFSPEGMQAIEATLAAQFPPGGRLGYRLQGGTGFRYYFWQSLQHDQALNLAVSLFLILLFRGLYGTWRSGMVAVATLTLTTTVVLSLMGLSGATVDVLSNNLFLILSLAATEDMLYLCHFQARLGAAADWRAAPRRLVLPSFFTSLTTAVGFGSLCWSKMPPIQRLGMWAAAGAMLEWAIVCYALPAAMAKVPALRRLVRAEKAFLLAYVARLAGWRLPARPVLGVSAALLVLSGAGFWHLRANDSIQAVWPEDHPYTRALGEVRAKFGWDATIDLLVRGEDGEKDLAGLAAKVAGLGSVFRVEGKWDAEALVLRDLPPGSAWRGVAVGEIAHADALRRYLAPSGRLRRLVIYMKDVSLGAVEELAARVRDWCPAGRCALSGDVAALSSLSDDVIGTLIGSFLLSLLIVSGVIVGIGFALGVKPVWRLLASAMWGPILLFGLVPLALDGINFVTSVTCAVMVGLAGDNAIQFMFAGRKKGFDAGIEHCQGGSYAMGLVMSLASLVYLGSAFLQPRRVGMAFAVGYLLLVVGDVVVLKALLQLGQRRNVPAGQRAGWWLRPRLR